jgi:hypothetical protein
MQLSAEDVALVKNHGVPSTPGAEFVAFSSDGSLRFTDRGRRLYRFAMLMHGLSPEKIEAVRTQEDLRSVSLLVKEVRLIHAKDAAERAMKQGEIPARAREMLEAALHGTPEDLHRATERRLQCEQAGANVIPVSFGTKRA